MRGYIDKEFHNISSHRFKYRHDAALKKNGELKVETNAQETDFCTECCNDNDLFVDRKRSWPFL